MDNVLKKMTKIELDAEREVQLNNKNINEDDRQKRVDLINEITLLTNKKEVV